MSDRFKKFLKEKMASFYYARVNYKNVIGSNLETRSAFDGSVPYCVSCSTVLSQAASEADVTSSAYFSIIGQANSGGVDVDSVSLQHYEDELPMASHDSKEFV